MKSERFSFLFQRCSLIYLTLVQTERKMRLSEKKTELAQVFSSVSILSKYKMKSERFSFLFQRCSLIYLKSQIKLMYARLLVLII